MQSFFLYIRLQYRLLITLLFICVVPLLLIYIFVPYRIEHLHFIFLTLLIGLRITFFGDVTYKLRLEKVVSINLAKELKRSCCNGS